MLYKNKVRMKAVAKKQTAFRFDSDLLEKLKSAAVREHRSLNNYVESLLMELVYNTPNDETKAAIEEARLGEGLKSVDTSNLENFLNSCSE